MFSGVYKISNRLNGKIYIGSSKNVKSRWDTHQRDLKNGRHYNKRMQEDYDSSPHKDTCFDFTVVGFFPEEDLIEKEHEFCKRLNACDPNVGYNKKRPLGVGFRPQNIYIDRNLSLAIRELIQRTGKTKKDIYNEALQMYLDIIYDQKINLN